MKNIYNNSVGNFVAYVARCRIWAGFQFLTAMFLGTHSFWDVTSCL